MKAMNGCSSSSSCVYPNGEGNVGARCLKHPSRPMIVSRSVGARTNAVGCSSDRGWSRASVRESGSVVSECRAAECPVRRALAIDVVSPSVVALGHLSGAYDFRVTQEVSIGPVLRHPHCAFLLRRHSPRTRFFADDTYPPHRRHEDLSSHDIPPVDADHARAQGGISQAWPRPYAAHVGRVDLTGLDRGRYRGLPGVVRPRQPTGRPAQSSRVWSQESRSSRKRCSPRVDMHTEDAARSRQLRDLSTVDMSSKSLHKPVSRVILTAPPR
jgi:hypothetical protein